MLVCWFLFTAYGKEGESQQIVVGSRTEMESYGESPETWTWQNCFCTLNQY